MGRVIVNDQTLFSMIIWIDTVLDTPGMIAMVTSMT